MISITNESKIIKDTKEETLIKRLLAIDFSLTFIQAVILSMNTYKQEIIEVENENEKLETKIDETIVIIFLYCHFWGVIIVYGY